MNFLPFVCSFVSRGSLTLVTPAAYGLPHVKEGCNLSFPLTFAVCKRNLSNWSRTMAFLHFCRNTTDLPRATLYSRTA